MSGLTDLTLRAALDGRGKLVNIDPFGYDHVLDHTRQALACGLFADAVGLVGAIWVGYLFYR